MNHFLQDAYNDLPDTLLHLAYEPPFTLFESKGCRSIYNVNTAQRKFRKCICY